MRIQFLTRCVADRLEHPLVVASRKKGHQVEVIDVGQFVLCTGEKPILYQGTPWKPVDLVYPFWAKRDSFMPLLLLSMREQGQKVYKPLYREIPDKLSAAVLFQAAGLPTPTTYSSSTFSGISSVFDKLSWPVILKIAQSAKGEGVFMINSLEVLSREVKRLCEEGCDYVIQECVYPLGRDVRAFVLDGRIYAAMERLAPAGEFRANIARGAVGREIRLTKEESTLVLRACALFDLPMAGVDFIRTDRGPLLLEVNREPGYAGLRAATGKDAASAVVDHFSSYVDSSILVK
ncbi:MAG: hypothetical protein VX278_05110 [Myxococcota bacterium]|nr:hypothetical protein [Myxococcota bacterium]